MISQLIVCHKTQVGIKRVSERNLPIFCLFGSLEEELADGSSRGCFPLLTPEEEESCDTLRVNSTKSSQIQTNDEKRNNQFK
jgi:hypothetical protein